MVLLRIRLARKYRGWNQTQLARKSLMCQQDISKIERGRLIPTPSETERLANVLCMPSADLLKPVIGGEVPR